MILADAHLSFRANVLGQDQFFSSISAESWSNKNKNNIALDLPHMASLESRSSLPNLQESSSLAESNASPARQLYGQIASEVSEVATPDLDGFKTPVKQDQRTVAIPEDGGRSVSAQKAQDRVHDELDLQSYQQPIGSAPESNYSKLVQQMNKVSSWVGAAGEAQQYSGSSSVAGSPPVTLLPRSHCQIYLTFPAHSTFTEEDVKIYFQTWGAVEDVRIPVKEKRNFGFVTFTSPLPVKAVLASPVEHRVKDCVVLVKPYSDKGKATSSSSQFGRGKPLSRNQLRGGRFGAGEASIPPRNPRTFPHYSGEDLMDLNPQTSRSFFPVLSPAQGSLFPPGFASVGNDGSGVGGVAGPEGNSNLVLVDLRHLQQVEEEISHYRQQEQMLRNQVKQLQIQIRQMLNQQQQQQQQQMSQHMQDVSQMGHMQGDLEPSMMQQGQSQGQIQMQEKSFWKDPPQFASPGQNFGGISNFNQAFSNFERLPSRLEHAHSIDSTFEKISMQNNESGFHSLHSDFSALQRSKSGGVNGKFSVIGSSEGMVPKFIPESMMMESPGAKLPPKMGAKGSETQFHMDSPGNKGMSWPGHDFVPQSSYFSNPHSVPQGFSSVMSGSTSSHSCQTCYDMNVEIVHLDCQHSLCANCFSKELAGPGKRCPLCHSQLSVLSDNNSNTTNNTDNTAITASFHSQGGW